MDTKILILSVTVNKHIHLAKTGGDFFVHLCTATGAGSEILSFLHNAALHSSEMLLTTPLSSNSTCKGRCQY